MIEKLQIGTKINVNETNAIISSEIMKFKDTLAIYADIVDKDSNKICEVGNITEQDIVIAVILRNKQKMKDMGLTTEERKAIYCHELGHTFSENQIPNQDNRKRQIENEVDADTCAVEKYDILPEVLQSALKKTYKYEISNVSKKKDLTQEKLDKFIEEMSARTSNIERLIKQRNKSDIEI